MVHQRECSDSMFTRGTSHVLGVFSDPYAKNFPPEESPSGMIARSGPYHVRSRVVDDDKEVYTGKFSEASFQFGTRPMSSVSLQTLSGVSSSRKSGDS